MSFDRSDRSANGRDGHAAPASHFPKARMSRLCWKRRGGRSSARRDWPEVQADCAGIEEGSPARVALILQRWTVRSRAATPPLRRDGEGRLHVRMEAEIIVERAGLLQTQDG